MKKCLIYNLKVLLLRKEFYISISIMLLLITIHTYLNIYTKLNFLESIGRESPNSNVYLEFMRPYAYQMSLSDIDVPYKYVIMILFPLLATSMYSDSYLMENKYKISNYLNVRFERKKNLLSKLILIFVISFTVVFLVLILDAIVNSLIFSTANTSDIYLNHIYDLGSDGNSVFEYFRVNNLHLYVLFNLLRFSLFTSLMAVISFIISLYINNRILINFSPLLILLVSHLFLTTVGLTLFSILSNLDFHMSLQYHQIISMFVILMIIITLGFKIFLKNKRDSL